MLVIDGDRVLLGRQPLAAAAATSALAGFVEPGESLEEAVAREVLEEAGVEVAEPRYVASQPWPFPASLMLGFVASYAGGEPRAATTRSRTCAGSRATSRRGRRRPRASSLPPPLAIARRLIDGWLGGL